MDDNIVHTVMQAHGWRWATLRVWLMATRERRRLVIGALIWLALGIVTAKMDTFGLISLCGGVGGWLFAGLGLALTAMLTHRVAARHRRRAAIATAAACLGILTVLLAVVDWNAVATGIFYIAGFIGLATLIIQSPGGLGTETDEEDETRWAVWIEDGYYNHKGVWVDDGYYSE